MYGAEIAMTSTQEGKKWSVYRRSDAAFCLDARACLIGTFLNTSDASHRTIDSLFLHILHLLLPPL